MRLIVGILVALLLVAGLVFSQPARLTLLFLAGRSPYCPWQQAIQADSHQRAVTAAKDRILAASRLVEQDSAGYELWDTPKGRFWIPAGNQYSLPFNLAEQETDIYARDELGVRKGDVVLDCGANVGVYTRHALERGARLVVAIEPAPANLECLRRTFAPEIEQGRVIVYPKGVWDKDDVLTLYLDPSREAAASFVNRPEGWKQVERVPLTTIDHLVAQLNLSRVDFIKMDIEGAEPRAIAGARRTLVRHQPRLAICTYHEPRDPVTVPATVFRANPEYRQTCGDCQETKDGIRPIVLLFQ